MNDQQYNYIINLSKNILRRLKKIEKDDELKALEERPRLLDKISENTVTILDLQERISELESELNKKNDHITALRDARNKAEKETQELKLQLRKLKESINV